MESPSLTPVVNSDNPTGPASLEAVIAEYKDAKLKHTQATNDLNILFKRIIQHPDTVAATKDQKPGTHTVNEFLKVVTKDNRKWDQEKLNNLKSKVSAEFWPFKQEFKEDANAMKVFRERFPKLVAELETALTTSAAKETLKL